MDKNRIEGAVKQTKGSIKEAIGKISGDKKTELEGTVEKQVGKVQSTAGKVADQTREKIQK
jgi:uncharacterized protein YjbJ (UPF0337 family)